MKISYFLFSAIVALMPAMLHAQTYDFEQDGLYYRINGTSVNVVLPESAFKYSGAITLPSSVTNEGETYQVNLNATFTNSEITEFTLGEGWGHFSYNSMMTTFTTILLNNKTLDRVTIMSPGENTPEPSEYSIAKGLINCGDTNVGKCTISYDGENYTLNVSDLNVFDGDGNRLEPCTWGESGRKFGYPEKTEVDGKPVYHFNLGPDMMASYRDSGGVMPLSGSYDAAFLYFNVGDRYVYIRLHAAKYDSGIYHVVDGIRYSEFGNELAVLAPEDGVYAGDVVIPAAIRIGDKDMAVSRIAPNAFYGSAITSLSLPSTVTEIGSQMADASAALEKVDLSACTHLAGTGSAAFRRCTSLKEVVMPATSDPNFVWSSFFNDCVELERISMPQGGSFSNTLTGCTKLIGLDILTNDDEKATFTVNPQIYRNDGVTLLKMIPVTTTINVTSEIDSEGKTVYSVDKSQLYNDFGKYNGNISFKFEDEEYVSAVGNRGAFKIDIPEKGMDAVTAPAVTDVQAPVEYYNLQGVRVAEPAHGLYIRRQGAVTEKVIIK